MTRAKTKTMTTAEYAKHRGCSAAAVRRAIREGRIAAADRMIDPEAADASWAAASDPTWGGKRRGKGSNEPSTVSLTDARRETELRRGQLLDLPIELVLPAHGEPTDRAALERLLG